MQIFSFDIDFAEWLVQLSSSYVFTRSRCIIAMSTFIKSLCLTQTEHQICLYGSRIHTLTFKYSQISDSKSFCPAMLFLFQPQNLERMHS